MTALEVATGRVRGEWRSHEDRPCVFAALLQGLLLTDAAGADRNLPRRLTLRRWSDGAVLWRVPFECRNAAGGSVNAAGTLLAYSPRRGEVALYDLRRRQPRPERFAFAGEAGPYSLALTPDGSRVTVGWDEGTLVTWDVASGQEAWRSRSHRGQVIALAWNAAGTALASSAFDGCGGWRNECVVVTRPGPGGPQSQVAWWRRFQAAQTVEWVGEDRLLLAHNDGARTMRAPK